MADRYALYCALREEDGALISELRELVTRHTQGERRGGSGATTSAPSAQPTNRGPRRPERAHSQSPDNRGCCPRRLRTDPNAIGSPRVSTSEPHRRELYHSKTDARSTKHFHRMIAELNTEKGTKS